jgi:hypothetical protein
VELGDWSERQKKFAIQTGRFLDKARNSFDEDNRHSTAIAYLLRDLYRTLGLPIRGSLCPTIVSSNTGNEPRRLMCSTPSVMDFTEPWLDIIMQEDGRGIIEMPYTKHKREEVTMSKIPEIWDEFEGDDAVFPYLSRLGIVEPISQNVVWVRDPHVDQMYVEFLQGKRVAVRKWRLIDRLPGWFGDFFMHMIPNDFARIYDQY